MNGRRVFLGVAFGLLLTLALVAVLRVGELAGLEGVVANETVVGPVEARPVTLVEATLTEGQLVTLEVCSRDRFDDPRWIGGGALRVVYVEEAFDALTTELGAATLAGVRRGETLGCLEVAVIDTVREAGRYAVMLDWTPVERDGPEIELVARILARPVLTIRDRGLLTALLFASFLLVSALVLAPMETARRRERAVETRELGLRLLAALAVVTVAFFATGLLPPGAAVGLLGGIGLAGAESAAAFVLAPTGPASFLGLVPPRRVGRVPGWAFLPLALLVGVLLVLVAVFATRLVPSTGVSPVQTFLASPSGRMSFLALAVIAPVAEELFFRGLVYGLVARWSSAAAFLAAWLLFTLAHAQQDFHQWGALLAVLIAGLALTALRVASGSTAVSAVGHLSYNGLLALLSAGA